jgi:hypothetical protein
MRDVYTENYAVFVASFFVNTVYAVSNNYPSYEGDKNPVSDKA